MNSYLSRLTPAFMQLAQEIELVPDSDGKVMRSAGKQLPEVARSIQHWVFKALPRLIDGSSASTSASLDKNHYSSSYQYNTENFLYNIHVGRAFNKLRDAGYIQVSKKGYLDRTTKRSDTTKYLLTSQFKSWLMRQHTHLGFEGDIADLIVDPILIPSDALVRVQHRVQDDYSDREPRTEKVSFAPTDQTSQIENDVRRLNNLLRRTWIDLDLNETQWDALQQKLKAHNKTDRPNYINFTERRLYRVFNNLAFSNGGRFYGGWWQTIPSEYRKHIVINGKATVEIDFSGLHPAILYAKKGLPIPEDPYTDILGPEHRKLAKKLFNALINAKHDIRNPPSATKIRHTGKTWQQIKDRICELHAPIREYFCTGAGLWLMYEDSVLATDVMLRFADKAIPCLPVHDSFIVHHGYEAELKQYMSEAFQRRYGIEPALKGDEVVFINGGSSFGPDSVLKDVLDSLNLPQERRLTAFRSLVSD